MAVWFHAEVPVPPPPDYDARLQAAAGQATPRFAQLHELLAAHRPAEPHHHLCFLAVLPAWQNAVIAGTLLGHHHSHLDAIGMPAYSEATGPDSRRLYVRHGYERYGSDFSLPNETVCSPMWRRPRSGPALAGSGAVLSLL